MVFVSTNKRETNDTEYFKKCGVLVALCCNAFYNYVNIGQRGVLVMNDSNMSDNIETYLKRILQQAHEIEIRRVELAQRFNVVPSQINYVIKTRFNTENGYLVESKRGGGGYIRIVKMALRNEPRLIEEIKQQLPKIVSFRTATSVVSSLCREQILTVHESELILTLLSKETLSVGDVTVQGHLRARLLQQLLSRLRFESERN